jgi:hypothetical protein
MLIRSRIKTKNNTRASSKKKTILNFLDDGKWWIAVFWVMLVTPNFSTVTDLLLTIISGFTVAYAVVDEA